MTNSPYANHFLDEVLAGPDRFDPERFSAERHEDKVHRLAFQAFGAGVHKCIGMYFAGMQVRAVFHELLREYHWSVARRLRDADRPGGAAVPPRRAAGDPGATAMSDEILDAARDVFEQYGARRANVDDVARKAGISRSTLYRRLPQQGVAARRGDRPGDQRVLRRAGPDRPGPAAAGGDGRVLRARDGDDARDPGARPAGQDRAGDDQRHPGADPRAARAQRPDRPRPCAAPAPGCPTTSCTWWPSCCCGSPRRSCSTRAARLDVNDPVAVRDYAKRYLSQLVE